MQLVGYGNVVGVAKQVVIPAVDCQEASVVFNGFAQARVGAEVVVNINASAVVDFTSLKPDGLPVVRTLDTEEVVARSGLAPATFEDGLSNRN